MLKACPFCGVEICWPRGDAEPRHFAICAERKAGARAGEDPTEENFFDSLDALDVVLEETNKQDGDPAAEDGELPEKFGADPGKRGRPRKKLFQDPELEEGAAVADDLEGGL